MTEKKQDKLPVSQMIGFALNGCGSSCIAGIMGGFLTIYLTDNLLLSMGFITAMKPIQKIYSRGTRKEFVPISRPPAQRFITRA